MAHLQKLANGHLGKTSNGKLSQCVPECTTLNCDHCYCCSPSKYLVEISGGAGACSAVNGLWKLTEIALATYRYDDGNVTILLQLDEPAGNPRYTCQNMRLTATEKAGPAQCFQDTGTLDEHCTTVGAVDGFSWSVCPIDEPTPDTIEVTIAGVDAAVCTGCFNTEANCGIKDVNIAVDGTYTLSPAFASCAWTYLIPDGMIHLKEVFNWPTCTSIFAHDNYDCTLSVIFLPGPFRLAVSITAFDQGNPNPYLGCFSPPIPGIYVAVLPIGPVEGRWCRDAALFQNLPNEAVCAGTYDLSSGGTASVRFV